MSKTTAKNKPAVKGKYSCIIQRPQRCPGCRVLCANMQSLNDHAFFCEKAKERRELTPIRGIEFIRGDLRGWYK